VETIK